MNIKTVSTLLGHSKIDTTADIYLHVQPEFAAEEMKKFANLNMKKGEGNQDET